MKKELIIFDLDGTLVDSVPSLRHALNLTFEYEFDEKLVRLWVGNGALKLTQRALKHLNLDEKNSQEWLEKFLKNYKNNLTKDLKLYKGVLETLNELKNRKFKLAIATNKPDEFVKEILDNTKIDRFFSLSVGAGVVKQKKPEPEIIYYICGKLKTPLQKVCFVGDSKSDILAAKAAKVTSICLTYGYNQGEDLSSYGPDFLFDNFEDILGVL